MTEPEGQTSEPPHDAEKQDDEAVPVEQETTPVEQEESPVEQEEAPLEQEQSPVQQEEAPVEQEETPVEQEATPEEQDAAAADQSEAETAEESEAETADESVEEATSETSVESHEEEDLVEIKGSKGSSSSSSTTEEEEEEEEDEDDEALRLTKLTVELIVRKNPLDDLPFESVAKLVEDLQYESRHLTIENDMFERYLMANDPTLLEGMAQSIENAVKMQGAESVRRATLADNFSIKSLNSATRVESTVMGTSSIIDKGPKINMTQRTNLVMKETEEIQKNLNKFYRDSHKRKCILRAELEEVGLEINETLESSELFEQTVVIEGLDPLTQRIPAEKFTRFMHEWLKASSASIQRYRLRSSTLSSHLRQLRVTLKEKKELGESLHIVDFEKLQIENNHFINEIDQRGVQLMDLKRMNGGANLILTNQKKFLMKQMTDMQNIERDIAETKKRIEDLEYETEKAEEQLMKTKAHYDGIREMIEKYRVPDVMEYVRIKGKLYDLQKNIKIWSRRSHLQDVALKSSIREMKNITGSRKVQDSWFHSNHPQTTVSDLEIKAARSSDEEEEEEEENKWIWKTDLDFMVVHRDRLVILSFMTSNGTNTSPSSISQARVVSATTKPSTIFATPAGVPLSHHPVAHTVIRTLKDLIGHENHTAYQTPKDPELGYTLSLEFINLGIALMVYSIRYSAIFWSTNKCLGIIFSIQLLINSVHTLLSYCGMTILYKVQIAGIWKSLPLLKHTNFAMMPNRSTPFLLNAQVTLGLYLLSTLLVVASSLILYFYGHTRFNEFLNRECQRKIISLKRDNIHKWSYFTHCAALCVLISVGICYAPLLHDYTFVYKGSLDDITLACIIGGILHLFLWVVIWLFLTIKQKWIFKLRVVVGRASVKQARSLRLITDVDLSRNLKDAPDQPLLVVANGRTYGVMDVSPQKAIMNIVKKSTTVRRAIHHDATPNVDEDEEQIYWLRPALSNQQPSPDQAKQLCCFTKKEKQKVTFNETASTSNNRCKINGSKTRRIPGMDEDDGDYATLRELPLPPINQINNNENDTVSEEGKLLACVHDENITYASTNQDLIPPLDYEDPSPLLTPDPLPNPPESSGLPLLIHNNSNASQSSTQNQTPRCLRRADSGMPHEEANSRSDSISTESSHSPPDAPESNHSESSSGVHSNDSREHKQTRRATSVVDLMQPPPREEVQWKSFSLQRNVLPPTNNNFNATSPPMEKDGIPNVILEEGENTVIIRRKSCRPNMEVSQTTLETFGRATNMRMVSFTEKTDLSNMQSTSATLPHYPTQPLPNIYPNCSTMPLPPHNNVHTTNMGMGNSCNIYPRQHSTIPTHLNGVTVKMFNGSNGHHQPSQNAHYAMHGNRLPCKQDLKSTDLIYSRIYRNPNVYHQSS